jgi:hypothetical protein
MALNDKAAVMSELENLQLEEARERVLQMRQQRESRVRRIAARTSDIQRSEQRQKYKQENCWHKKGGQGVENLARGRDHYYAVIKHQLCHGPIIAICQRCGKVWEPPPQELNKRSATPEQKAEYKLLYIEYMAAIEFPTDNTMSGTQLFQINEAAA